MAQIFPMNLDQWRTAPDLGRYVDGMTLHQSAMRRRLAKVRLTAQDRRRLERIARPVHVLVMTEAWCADSLMNLPIVVRIVAAAPQMDLRIFSRSRAAALNDFYIRKGYSRIPVITFLDEDFQEMGTWMERPQAASAKIAEWFAEHPEGLESPGNPGLSPEERQRLVEGAYGDFVEEMEGWYDDFLGQATVDELIPLIAAG